MSTYRSRRKRRKAKNIVKSTNRTILYVIIAIFIIASILIGSTLYNSNKSREGSMETVNNVSNFFLEELAARRVKLISSELESKSTELALSIGCIDDEDLKSIKALRRYIGRIKSCYNLNKFALVDENGYIYTDHSTATALSMYPFLSETLKEHYMGTTNIYGTKKQLIIANPVRDVVFQGAKITSCFMELDIQNMFSSMTLNSVQTDVYYNIYYKNGESLTKNSIGNREGGRNLMSELKEASFGSGNSTKNTSSNSYYEKIESDFENGNSGFAEISFNGVAERMYYTPVENADWMLAVFIRENAIGQQISDISSTMFKRSILQISIMMTACIVAFIVFYFMMKRSVNIYRAKEHAETARLEAENAKLEAESAQKSAEKANRAKTTFLNNMSHDMRTPMNAIIGFTNLAKKNISDTAKIEDYPTKINVAGDHLLSLINDVLDMSRIESGKIELEISPMSVQDMMDEINTIMVGDMKEHGLEFTINNDVTHDSVECDRLRLKQVIINLLSNAMKFTPEGGSVSIGISETSGEQADIDSYVITVADTGIGMSPDFCKKVFEAFERERTSTVSGIQGTGLGMSITKKLVDMMGGRISVESEVGIGTTFTVELPLKKCETAAPQEVSPAAGTADEDIKLEGVRVLLVDDNSMNIEIAEVILSEYGMIIDTADDGTTAVSKVRQNDYDIILMDIQMQVMDGYEATKMIRNMNEPRKSRVPIIAMTANVFEEDRRVAFDVGMNGHIAKPFDVEKMLETIQSVLREKKKKVK